MTMLYVFTDTRRNRAVCLARNHDKRMHDFVLVVYRDEDDSSRDIRTLHKPIVGALIHMRKMRQLFPDAFMRIYPIKYTMESKDAPPDLQPEGPEGASPGSA